MRYAIISDIHGNLQALHAVFKHIDEQTISCIVCLGDIVGYGADFEACLDLVADRCGIVLCGNHDEAVLHGPIDFNPVARDVIHYTRTAMKPGLLPRSGKRSRWGFLKSLKKEYKEGIFAFYHGSPRDPVKEYIMRTDVVFAPDKLRDIFIRIEKICFVGHTHQPGVIEEDQNFHFLEPKHINHQYEIGQKKAVINVGSVGQPRDGDNRASFVIVDDKKVCFIRVPYDFQETMRRIEENEFIHNNCAARLAIGK
ncbi:MAG: metallophosphoesterase family protein [Planctomycetota bacterium]